MEEQKLSVTSTWEDQEMWSVSVVSRVLARTMIIQEVSQKWSFGEEAKPHIFRES